MANSAADVKQAIEASLPLIEVESLRWLGEGMDSVAWLVNESLVCRMPRNEETAEFDELARVLMPEIANAVSVPVPVPAFFGRNPTSHLSFSIYPLLKGQSLDTVETDRLTDRQSSQLADDIALFIEQLHAFPVQRARELGVHLHDVNGEYQSDYAAAQRLVRPLVDDDLWGYMSGRFEAWFSDQSNHDYVPTLLHGDLGVEHMLVDPLSCRLTGVIDFGDVHIGDPDYELHWYGSAIRPKYADILIETLKADTPLQTRKRAFFYFANFVQDFVFGVEENQQDGIEWALSGLRQLMAHSAEAR